MMSKRQAEVKATRVSEKSHANLLISNVNPSDRDREIDEEIKQHMYMEMGLKRRSKSNPNPSSNQLTAAPEARNTFKSTIGKPIKIYLDGPYGAPATAIFSVPHAILIGAGIGVTPFASVLESILHRHRQTMHTCPTCSHTWTDIQPVDNALLYELRRVDFFWINRDQFSFEWFLKLLTKIEADERANKAFHEFLKIHIYMTGAKTRRDIKGLGLQMALDACTTRPALM
jgi:hypothetical protein